MSPKKFYISIISFLVIEYIFLLFVLPELYTIKSEIALLFMPLIIVLIVVLQYIILKKKIEKNKKDFVVAFMAVFTIKFLILLFGTLLYILYVSQNNIEFVVIFFINYFTSLILSVIGFVYLLKD